MIRLLAQSGLIKRIDKVLLSWVGLVVAALGTYLLFQFANQQAFNAFKQELQGSISVSLFERDRSLSLHELESKLLNNMHLQDISF